MNSNLGVQFPQKAHPNASASTCVFSFPPIRGMDSWFGRQESVSIYSLQRPEVHIPKSPIQATNSGLPNVRRSQPFAADASHTQQRWRQQRCTASPDCKRHPRYFGCLETNRRKTINHFYGGKKVMDQPEVKCTSPANSDVLRPTEAKTDNQLSGGKKVMDQSEVK